MNINFKVWVSLFLLSSSSHCLAQHTTGEEDKAGKVTKNFSTAMDTGFLYKLHRRPDSLFFNNRPELEAELLQLSFVSGYVYFSGTGFPAGTVATSVFGSILGVKNMLDRCGPGSRITLGKCIFLKKDGTRTQPISKSLFIK